MAKPATRLGDMHCPAYDGSKPHNVGPIIEGSTVIFIEEENRGDYASRLDRIAAVDTGNQRITYEYDQADCLIRAATWIMTNAEPESELQFVYDDKGRLEKENQNGITIEKCLGEPDPFRLSSLFCPNHVHELLTITLQ